MDTTLHDAFTGMLAEAGRPRWVTREPWGFAINTGFDCYELTQCDTPARALSWLLHLRDKAWFSFDHETDLLYALMDAGVFTRGR